MNSALWGCFQEGYEGPFGADADHLKKMDDLKKAVRVIARKDASLYRRFHQFALKSFEKDKSSYHVTTDISRIPDLKTISDSSFT